MPNDPMDLETVIEDAVNDSQNPEPNDSAVETDSVTESDGSTLSADDAAADAHPDGTDVPVVDDQTSLQVETPGQKQQTLPTEDDFAKKFGLQPNSVTGRENRIPYSRVKKIVEKNEKDTVARVTKEIESKFAPQLQERDTKIQDYEGRLANVAQFEQILENDPRQFLGMLSKHPAYAEFFSYVEQLASGQPQQTAQTPAQADPTAGMPQPDQTLSDGSKVYSMEGLQKLMAWQEEQAIQKAIRQVEERYKPIEQAWQSQEQMAKIVPVVEKQIAEARTWDQFNELEPKIVELLKADKNLSLERAYLKAYQEWSTGERNKLVTDRNKVRSEVLAELKKKPVSSAAPTTPVKPTQQQTSGAPRSLEDVINGALTEAGLK